MEIIETAVGSELDAERLARALLDARLAACVSIVPQRSIFRWQGVVSDEHEWLLRCKTTAERLSAALACIRAHHPYEAPEVVSCHFAVHHPAYEAWLASET